MAFTENHYMLKATKTKENDFSIFLFDFGF